MLNEKLLLNKIAEFRSRVRNGRSLVLRNKFENALFYLGQQWITYDTSLRGFRYVNYNTKSPRPVTNRYKAILDSIDSVLARVDPQLSAAPGTEKDDDRLTAELAQHVVKYCEKVVRLPELRARLSKGLVILNDMYLVLGYDIEGGPRNLVPAWVCPQHPMRPYSALEAQQLGGVCPEDGQPLVQDPDPSHGTEVPEGVLTTDVVTPFEMWVDYSIDKMCDQPVVMWRRMRPYPWVWQRYPETKGKVVKGYNATADIGLQYLYTIIRLTPSKYGSVFGSQVFSESVLVDDVWILPDKDLPKGAMVRVVNEDTIVEAVDLAYHDGTPDKPGRPFIPVVHYRYDYVPGAHVATGPADHLKEPQKERNRLQASVSLYFARSGNGVWAIPEGADLPTITGDEGLILRYDYKATGGATPQRIEGARLPASFWQRFNQIDNDMDNIAGTYDILRGNRPPNVESGYALDILRDRAQSRFSTLFMNWERGYAEWARMAFYIFRLHAPDEVYYQLRGEEGRWLVQKIKAADLRGGVDLDVESGSGQPKSLLQHRAAMEQAINMGLINPQDPKQRLKGLRIIGLPEMVGDMDADDRYISEEHQEFIKWAKATFDAEGRMLVDPQRGGSFTIFVDPLVDNHQLHFERHRVFMLSGEFRALPQPAQNAFKIGHFQQHLIILRQQAQAQMEQQLQYEATLRAATTASKGSSTSLGSQRADQNAVANQQGRGTTGRAQRALERRQSAA